jgi:hypothetical protein
MRDQIAEVLEISMDNVNDMDVTFEDIARAGADAILAALPDMIAPLVWEGVEDDCFVQSEAAGYTYELSVCDTLERSCDYVWRSDVRYMGKTEVNIATKSTASFEEAQAAANTHHRAAIMAAFTGETE